MFSKKNDASNFFAVDFGSSSIKVVKLKNTERNPSVVSFGSVKMPTGAYSSESEKHKKEISEALKSLVKDLNINTSNVATSLPDASIFTRIVKIPAKKESDLEEAVFWASKRNVPISLEDVQIDWSIVNSKQTEDGMTQYDILLVAAPKLLINRYVDILKNANLNPVFIETESLSLVRALSSINDATPSLILDFGYSTIEAVIAYKNMLLFNQTISTGSSLITKAISQEFNLEEVQAEEYKKNYGLDSTQLEGKIFRTITPIMDSIVNEVKRILNSYKSTEVGESPSKIILVGNGSMLPGLVLYLAQNLSIEVEVGNPYSKIYIDPNLKAKLPALLPGYAVATGLALKV
jgi:type IV pilus assembly protein PilM